MTDLEREQFRRFNGQMIEDMCALGSAILAAHGYDVPLVCRDPKCSVIGLHNTDECEDLIRQAKEEER